jgi:beta-glucuronidase
MPRIRPAALAIVAVAAAFMAAYGPARADVPAAGALYKDGPSGRYLIDGPWLFRLDTADRGLRSGFQRNFSTAGWAPTTVPNAWNATDSSVESMKGTVGWYRKDFSLPSASRSLWWVVRFESVNYRSRIWLNGHLIGTNRGAYLPFELRLPRSTLHRTGVNHLVIRVDNRRYPTDFPPSGLNNKGTPVGGWWNYGGILREVYLRRIDRLDFNTVQVLPTLPCATCTASVLIRATVRNFDPRSQRVRVTGTFAGRSLNLGTASVGAKHFATFVTRVRVAHPRLWSPASPNLYDLRLSARVGAGRGRQVQTWFTETGIRSIKVVSGHLYLNGRPLNFRGVGLHEDSLDKGFAIDNATRQRMISAVKELGATIIRSHYPLHPELQELADEQGVMLWSEIPVYAIKTKYLKQDLVRRLAANELRDNILINGNHPAIIVWSIGNELSPKPGPVQGFYIDRAVQTAHRLDPTRPVGLAVAGYPYVGCQPKYGPLDVIGINEYFGWYPGPNGSVADRSLLSDYLDSVRACYPNKAIVITETGAEANRHGPVEERGTYEFQQDYANFHFGVYATKPWLSGAIWWTLQEFRVRPDWLGGNPRPDPPFHQKGLLTLDWQKKPAWDDVHRIYTSTNQLGIRRK